MCGVALAPHTVRQDYCLILQYFQPFGELVRNKRRISFTYISTIPLRCAESSASRSIGRRYPCQRKAGRRTTIRLVGKLLSRSKSGTMLLADRGYDADRNPRSSARGVSEHPTGNKSDSGVMLQPASFACSILSTLRHVLPEISQQLFL